MSDELIIAQTLELISIKEILRQQTELLKELSKTNKELSNTNIQMSKLISSVIDHNWNAIRNFNCNG